MAKLMLIGDAAQIELTSDPEDGGIVATCVLHDWPPFQEGCGWAETYDGLGDATEYASGHADTGRG